MPHLPGTRALRTFEAAARHLNFTRAADELGLTPAAVSSQIREIEEQLGFALFTRTSRSIRLTAAGTLMFEAASDALSRLHQALARARGVARGREELRVSVAPRFATKWLFPRLARFQAANPGLRLSFDISDQVRDFGRDDIDVAIRFGRGAPAGARAERLFGATVAPVCSPALLAAGRRFRTPADLAGETLCHVDCRVDGLAWPDWTAWMAAAGVAGFDGSACIAFDDSAHVVQAVLEGGAVGLVELPLVQGELARGELVRLFDVGVAVGEDLAYHLVYPEAAASDPRVAAFRAWLLSTI